MNRTEFSNLLVQTKINSGVSTSELIFALKVMPSQLRRVEKAENNYNMSITLKYLHALGAELIIKDKNEELRVKDCDSLAQWLKEQRGFMSQRKISESTQLASSTIGRIESGLTKMTVDVFLSLAVFFNCQILIKPKKELYEQS